MHQPNAMNEAQGKQDKARSLLQPMPLIMLGHPFGETLEEWQCGVPVDCGARAADAVALVHEDMAYQVNASFSKIVLWDDIKDDLPSSFKISPVGVIGTGRLPLKKAEKIDTELQWLLKKSRVPSKQFLSITGQVSNATRIFRCTRQCEEHQR
jgi:hypothetical protein